MLAMQPDSSDSDPNIDRVMLFLYLVPVFGCVPALWTLYRQPSRPGVGPGIGREAWENLGDRAQSGNSLRQEIRPELRPEPKRQASDRQISRLAVTLGGTWLLASVLLAAGAQTSEVPAVSTLVASTIVTSSYFLINLWLMVQLLRRRRVWLPGVSDWGDRLP
jgi:hypothetical protein